jgi:PAS domain-containing protein
MMKPPVPRTSDSRPLGAAALDAHPIPTLVVDAGFRVVLANAAARRLLAAREGVNFPDVLSCTEPHAPGAGDRCPGCAFHRSVERALAGEAVRERGFVLRSGGAGEPADLHLIAFAAPFDRDGAPHAILAVTDANELITDPRVVRVCDGCGRIQDEEGQWHALHRYLEDRLGLEAGGPLCDACDPAGGGEGGDASRG